jgi:subtilisin family serine protease
MRTAGLGLLIELAPDDIRGLRDIRAGVRDELGPGWSVGYLFPAPRTADLGRFFLARGDVPASPAYPLSALAYDMSRGLADRLLAQVEPDLPSSSYRLDGPTGFTASVAVPSLNAAGLSSDDKWWSVRNVRADAAWNAVPAAGGAARGAGILVGHIDTGYTEHPEIFRDALNLTIDRDILDGDDEALDPLIKRWWFPLDNPGHGTGTSCVIASRPAGEVVGTAPEAVVVPIRSIISVVQVLDGDIARAVDYARSVGCRVISMSLGGRGFNGLQAAIARAVSEGIIVMAAAGNYVGFVSAPASYPECLAVAASTIDDQPWSGSSRGSEVDISAPGQAVWTAATNKGPNGPVYSIEQGDGTSYAVATLAGIAALWLAHHDPSAVAVKYGGRTQDVFRALVAQTCRTPPGWDTSRYGAGIVDAKALLDAALPASLPAVPAAAVSAAFTSRPALGQLAATWSDRTIEQIVTSLGKRLGGLAGVTGTDRLARYASEIRYLAGEDPVLHEALVPPTVAGGVIPLADAEADAQERLPGSAIDRRVSTGVSRELALALAGRA